MHASKFTEMECHSFFGAQSPMLTPIPISTMIDVSTLQKPRKSTVPLCMVKEKVELYQHVMDDTYSD